MNSLQNHFLIATPLNDPAFKRTVTYICEHNEEALWGWSLTSLRSSTTSLLDKLEIVYPDNNSIYQGQVYQGGPVGRERVLSFTLHKTIGAPA